MENVFSPKAQRTPRQWLELIRECQSCGLPVAEWCRIKGIPVNSYYNAFSRLRKYGFIEDVFSTATTNDHTTDTALASEDGKTVFVPVSPGQIDDPQMLAPVVPGSQSLHGSAVSGIVLETSSCLVHVSEHFSKDTLRKVMEVLAC